MGGRGTFGTKQNKLDRDSIVKALIKQGTRIVIEDKPLNKESIKKLSNNDLSILKDLINREEMKGMTVNLTSNPGTKDLGRPVFQKSKKMGDKLVPIVYVNRLTYKKRGIKYFNRLLQEGGYGKNIKSVPFNKPKKKETKIVKKTTKQTVVVSNRNKEATEEDISYLASLFE